MRDTPIIYRIVGSAAQVRIGLVTVLVQFPDDDVLRPSFKDRLT